MLVLEELSNLIKKSEFYSKNNVIETIILKYVVPHIKSPHGFMRARACSTFGKYWNIKYSMGDAFLLAVQSLINAINDKDLPVKLYGAISLRNLVRTKIVKANIVPILPQIVESVLKLMSEVDNEYLVEVLEYLIDKFTDQLKVFLPQICVGLAEQFVRICSKDDFFSEFSFSDKKDLSTPAAIQSLKTIQTLLYCARVDKALYPLLEPTIVTLLLRMESRLNDLFPDFIEIMAVYAYYTEKINEGMWNVFGMYCQYIIDFAEEHLKDFLVCIDNFISKEPDVFVKGPYLQQVCNIYYTILTNDKYGEAACLDASVLMEIILIFCKGKVDHILPQALDLALQKVKDGKVFSTRIGMFQVLICAIHCNPILVFNWLESKGWSKDVFTLWFQFITENIQTKHGLKLSNVALSSVLRVPFAQWPPVLQPQFKFIVLTIGDLQKDLNKLLEPDQSEAGDETESSNESDVESGDDEEIEDALTEEEQKLLGDLGGKIGKPVADTEDVSPALLSGEIHQRLYALYEEQKSKEEEEEGYQEDDDLENILEDIDEIAYFKQSLEVFSQQQPQIFEQFIQSLNPEEREKVNYLMNYRRESENNNNMESK